MADETTKKVLKLIATTSSKIKNLIIEDGQLIFIQDLGRIAFDYNNQRVFYNQIVELKTEDERLLLENPLNGYYFILESGVLWFYKDDWVQITETPKNILFIDDVELPELGQENKLYINKDEQSISIWDNEINQYITVANCTIDASEDDISNLFK